MTDATSADPSVLRGAESSQLASQLLVKAAAPLLVVGVLAIVRIVQNGATTRLLILLCGSLLSFVFLAVHLLHAVFDAGARKRSVGAMLAIGMALMPWLFAIYLVLIEGLWRLRLLRFGFSFRIMCGAAAFMALGWLLIKATDQATKLAKSIWDGRIRIV